MLISDVSQIINNKSWKVTTEPASEPVTLTQLKDFARIDTSAEDTFIEGLITAIRQACELYLGRALMTQTITMVMDHWLEREIKLPRSPLISVTGIYTTDEDGADTEYSSDYYYVVPETTPGRLVIKLGSSLPLNTERSVAGYKIVYVAGYGGADDVPQAIKEAIKMWATVSYEERAVTPDPPQEARVLLDPFMILRLNQ